MSQSLGALLEALRSRRPLIHCITNPISINDCANLILAAGGRPIMAEHPGEVAEITATAAALAVNLGNITDVRMESMVLAGQAAREAGVPMVLDCVGVGCSSLRRRYAQDYLPRFSLRWPRGTCRSCCASPAPARACLGWTRTAATGWRGRPFPPCGSSAAARERCCWPRGR